MAKTVSERLAEFRNNKSSYKKEKKDSSVSGRLQSHREIKSYSTINNELDELNSKFETISNGWVDSDTMDSTIKEYDDLKTKLTGYANYLKQNDDTENYNSVSEMLKSWDNNRESLLNYKNVYKKFDNSKDYNNALWYNKYSPYTYKVLKEFKTTDEYKNLGKEEKKFVDNFATNYGYSDKDSYKQNIADINAQIKELEGKADANYMSVETTGFIGTVPVTETKTKYEDEINKLKAQKKAIEKNYSNYKTVNKFDEYVHITKNADFDSISKNTMLEYVIDSSKDFTAYNTTLNPKKAKDVAKYLATKNANKGETLMLRWSDSPIGLLDSPSEGAKFDYLEDDEIRTFFYLLEDDEKKAQNFLNEMSKTLNLRMTEDIQENSIEYSKQHPVLATGLRTLSNLGSGMGIAEDIYNTISGKGIDQNSASHSNAHITNAITSTVGEMAGQSDALGGIFQAEVFGDELGTHLYNAGTTTIDMGIDILIGKGLASGFAKMGGTALTSATKKAITGKTVQFIMSSQAGANGIISAKDRGLSDIQALSIGTADAITEWLTEKYSIEAFLSDPKNIWKYIRNNAIAEPSEEIASGILGRISDDLIAGEDSEFNLSMQKYLLDGFSTKEAFNQSTKDFLNQLGAEGFTALLSGGAMGTMGAIADVNSRYQTGRFLNKNQSVDGLKSLATSEGVNIPNKLSNTKVGSLYREVGKKVAEKLDSANIGRFKSTIALRLTNLGETKANALKIADAIVKKQSGKSLTAEEIKAISSSENGKAVLKDIKSSMKGESVAWIERIDTRTTNKLNSAIQTKTEFNRLTEHKTNKQQKARNNAEGYKVDENATVKPQSISVDSDGKVVINTENGLQKATETVVDSNTAIMLGYADDMKGEEKRVFVENFDGKMDADAYYNSFELQKAYAINGASITVGRAHKGRLTDSQVLNFYKYGLTQRKSEIAKKQQSLDKLVEDFNKEHHEVKEGSFNATAIENVKLNRKQNAVVRIFKALASRGVNVVIENSTAEQRANNFENGWYDPETNTVHIDLNAGIIEAKRIVKDTMINTMSHELLHWAKEKSPELYEALKDMVLDAMDKSDYDSNTRIIIEMNRIKGKKEYQDLSKDKLMDIAIEEIVARACEGNLAKSELMTEIINDLSARGEGLVEKFTEAIHEAVKTVKDFLGILDEYADNLSEEAQTMQEVLGQELDAFVKAYDDLVKSALETNQALKGKNNKNSIEKTDKYSDRDTAYMDAVNRGDMETAQRLVDEVAKANGYIISGYHGTDIRFTIFDREKTSTSNDFGKGFYFTSSQVEAQKYQNDDAFGDTYNKIDGIAYDNALERIESMGEDASDDALFTKLYNEEFDKELKRRTDEGATINAYLKMEKPFIVSTTNWITEEEAIDIAQNTMYVDNVPDDVAISDWVHSIKFYAKQHDGKVDTHQFANNMGHSVKLTSALLTQGIYDGILDYSVGTKFDSTADYHAIALYPNKIKDSAPVTYDDNGNVILLSKRFDNDNKDIRYSDRDIKRIDSEGNKLTAEQQEFFKDSQNRDETGRLKVMYHGTPESFTIFDRKKSSPFNLYGRGFYFTDSKSHADQYGNVTKEYYLDIKNPISTYKDDNIITKKQLRKYLEVVAENEDYSIENYGTYDIDTILNSVYSKNKSDYVMIQDISATAIGDLVEAIELFNKVNGTTFDGLILATETVVFRPEQIKSTTNLNPTSNPDIRLSDREVQYTYNNLVSKPDMVITKLVEDISLSRAEIIREAKKNATVMGKKHNDGSISVLVDDIDTDVVISTDSIKHSLDRRIKVNGPVMLQIGKILKNSIKINELNPREDNIKKTYVLIGIAQNTNNEPYIVSFVVNSHTNKIDTVDVLYSANAKKETAVLNAPRDSTPSTVSTISISDLLKYVNKYFPDILPSDVLKHFGYSERPKGKLGESALFSDRDVPSVRSTLVDALDSITESEIDKQTLNKYRAMLDKIEKSSNELAEAKRELHDMMFTKGKYDAEKKKKLEATIKAKENTVNQWDKSLLRLESTKPFKDVVEREKKKAMQKQKVKGKEAMKDYRESVAHRTELKKLTDRAMKLNKWLNENSKDHHIPDALKTPVAELLNALDFSSKRLLKGGKETQKDVSFAERMRKVKEMLNDNSIQDGGMIFLEDGIREDFDKLVDTVGRLAEEHSQTENVLNNMTAEQLHNLNQVLRSITSSIAQANELIANNQYKNAFDCIRQTLKDAYDSPEYKSGSNTKLSKAWRGIKTFINWSNELPYYVFERFGKGGQSIFEELQDGQDKLSFLEKQILDFKKETFTDKQVADWEKEIHEFNVDGKTIKVSTAQLMGYYMLSLRKQAQGHLMGCGIAFGDMYDKEAQVYNAHITAEEMVKMFEVLTNEQIEIAKKLQNFMATVCGEWGNKISMARYGIRAFTETDYYPLKVDANEHNSENAIQQEESLYRLLNMSFTKQTNPKANNRVMIYSIFDVFAQHTSDMAKYNAMALPLLDALKWFNFRTTQPNGKDEGSLNSVSVKDALDHAYGKQAQTYVLDLLKDLNSSKGSGRSQMDGFLSKLMSGSKIAMVAFNFRVALLQATSYMWASNEINPLYLLKGLIRLPSIKKAEKYSGIALWKSFGNYDINITRNMTEAIKGKSTKDKLVEITLKGAEWGDKITWGYLWNACESEIKSTTNLKIGTDEFNQAVAKRLREIIYRTQVVDSILTRSPLMRSKDNATKSVTAFMSEPILRYNMVQSQIFKTIQDSKKLGIKTALSKHKGGLTRVVGVYVSSVALTTIVQSLVDALRDDDDEKEFYEKFLEAWKENGLAEITVLSKLPILSDVYSAVLSLVKYGNVYENEPMYTAWITKTIKSVMGWVNLAKDKGKATTYKNLYDTAQAISSLWGLPIGNAMREFVTLWNNTIGVMDENLKIKKYED